MGVPGAVGLTPAITPSEADGVLLPTTFVAVTLKL